MKNSRRAYSDKRRRKIHSQKKATFAEIFLRVIKAGFGRKIRAEVYPPREGFQMFVFFLEGKEKQLPIKRIAKFTPFFLNRFRLGVRRARRGESPISYHRDGFPALSIVVVVCKLSQTGKKYAFAAADRVAADIVQSGINARIRAENQAG